MNALLALATLILLVGSSWAEGTKFSVKTTAARNLIQFVSEAPLERIVGRTDEVTGDVTVDLSDLAGPGSGTIRVPLGNLDTGLSLRNEHMRQNHLETSKYPEVVWRITEFVSADPPGILSGGTSSTLIRGELELHGVTKEYEILGQLS
ncbi:MAG: YceI family protein [bacterium]|nr:YceI family protein [bacterium]